MITVLSAFSQSCDYEKKEGEVKSTYDVYGNKKNTRELYYFLTDKTTINHEYFNEAIVHLSFEKREKDIVGNHYLRIELVTNLDKCGSFDKFGLIKTSEEEIEYTKAYHILIIDDEGEKAIVEHNRD